MTRVALCGLGNIGRVHLANLQSLRGCEVAGLFDVHRDALASVARDSGVKAYPSFSELIADPSISAVVIATPSETHRALGEQALAAGKHVFVEKPLADTLEDAQALIEAARRSPSLVVQVGFCERFNPQYMEAHAAVRRGSLGNVRAIHSSRVAPYHLGNAGWALGVLDTAVHNIDLALWMMDSTPLRVLARGVQLYPATEMPHSVTTLLEFDGGALVTDTITWLADEGHPLHNCARARMHIVGDKGSFDIDLTGRPAALLSGQQYRQVDTVLLGGEGYYSCLKLQFEGFLRSVEEGTPVLAPLQDAFNAERVVLAAHRSLATGEVMEL